MSKPSKTDDPKKPSQAGNNGESKNNSSIRHRIGRSMDVVSRIINENLVAARYGTMATIALITVYGVANTPLFFRFRTVQDIPASSFHRRHAIFCRLIRVESSESELPSGDTVKPIVCWIRHMSPVGQFLITKSAFEYSMRFSPAALIGKKLEDATHDLLRVEIAGIQQPPPYSSQSVYEKSGDWLRRLAEDRTPVKCELMHRRNVIQGGFLSQSAICRLSFRPGGHILRKDLASTMVQHGRASVLPSGLFVEVPGSELETSSNTNRLRQDAKYMGSLMKLEHRAIGESLGMWADPVIREQHKDSIDEAELQANTNTSMLRRIWQWTWGLMMRQ